MDLTRTHVLIADETAMRRLSDRAPRYPADRERLGRITAPGARLRFVVGRALVARLLDLAGAPSGTGVRPDSRGCPRLDPPGGLAVSISHTHGWVAAALTAGTRCGLDVQERIDPAWFPATTLAGVLPTGWAARLTRHHAPADELTRMWVVLEAALKWRGTGFSAPVGDLRFATSGAGTAVVDRASGDRTRVDVWTLPGGTQLAATVGRSGAATVLHTTSGDAVRPVPGPHLTRPLSSSLKG